jgi:hypothetical protein
MWEKKSTSSRKRIVRKHDDLRRQNDTAPCTHAHRVATFWPVKYETIT